MADYATADDLPAAVIAHLNCTEPDLVLDSTETIALDLTVDVQIVN